MDIAGALASADIFRRGRAWCVDVDDAGYSTFLDVCMHWWDTSWPTTIPVLCLFAVLVAVSCFIGSVGAAMTVFGCAFILFVMFSKPQTLLIQEEPYASAARRFLVKRGGHGGKDGADGRRRREDNGVER